MKKFLINLGVFALCVFLVFIVVELYLLRISNEYAYKKHYVEKNKDQIQTLILGHSHVAEGINPEHLGNRVFNMAIMGRNLYYDAVLAQRYIPQMKSLKCVIWSLGYNFEFENFRFPCMEKKENYSSTYRCMYEKYMGISYGMPYIYWSEILNSKFEYGMRIFKKDFYELNNCDSLGFELRPENKKASDWKNVHLPLKIDYNSSNVSKAFQKNMVYLKQLAMVCKEADVRLVVVTTPCYQSFLEKTIPKEIEIMHSCIDTLKTVYSAVEYYDFMFDNRFTEDDFSDASHLSYRGAERFTRILKNECLKDE